MPRGDGTGPSGAGARTGRGLGNCSPGVGGGLGLALGLGLGLGLRRGFRNFWRFNQTKENELEDLKGQASVLEENLSQINTRINELEDNN